MGRPAEIGNDSSVPVVENNHSLSPFFAPAANKVPAERTTTYCCPWYANVLAGALTPESVWNCHNRSPLRLSSAVRRPSLQPTNTNPPAVASDPLQQSSRHCWRQTRRLVLRSIAAKIPRPATPE